MTKARHLLVIPIAALAFAGCGSDDEGDPIPRTSVDEIEAQLDNIEAQIAQGSVGACNDIKAPGNTFETLEAEVENVPESVDADVRNALDQSVARLGELVDEECTAREEETETVPEETETVTVETVPEETPTETVETVPPEEDEDDERVPPGQLEQPEKPGNGPQDGGTGPGGGEGGSGGGAPVPGGDG